MIKTKKFTVDGDEYEIRQFGAVEGRKIWLKILHVLAPPIKELAQHESLNDKGIVSAISILVQNLDDETAESLYVAFGKTCTVRMSGDKGDRWPQLEGQVFDHHFAGKYVSMSKWLFECVSFNFADFLGDMSLGKMTDLVKEAASKRGSQTSSIGTSIES